MTAVTSTDLLCRTGSNEPLRFCRLGEIAVGFLRTWYIAKGVNDTFYFESTSGDFPYKKRETNIFIR